MYKEIIKNKEKNKDKDIELIYSEKLCKSLRKAEEEYKRGEYESADKVFKELRKKYGFKEVQY